MTISIIDFAAHSTPQSLAVEIESSLKSTGFFFLMNHGLEESTREMFELSESFFIHETAEEKTLSAIHHNKGWASFKQEALDPTLHAEGDPKEAFNIAIIPSDNPHGAQRLPATLLKEHAAIRDFQKRCYNLCQKLLEAFALILKVDINFLTSQHSFCDSTPSILRLLHYPAIPAGSQVSPNRAGQHSDYGSCTLLFQKSGAASDGLQILPSTERIDSENWQDVGVVEDALLVNVGDALEFVSGSLFKSTLHRVRLPSPIPAKGVPERYSIAYFNQPDPDTILKSVVETTAISEIDIERMKRKGVKPGVSITASEHLNARLAATYNLA